MYFRLEGNAIFSEVSNKMEFEKYSAAWFDSYFNGFSLSKWRKYTKLTDLSLQIEFKGRFKVTIYTKELISDQLIEKSHKSEEVRSTERSLSEIDIPMISSGLLYFKMEALEDDSEFYGGYYKNKKNYIRDINIALVICTYKREKYVEKNIGIINQYILENESSPLFNHLEVYIADNSRTLDHDTIASDKVKIFPNKNAGGAGGFTRGLIEILKSNQKNRKVTHALLMDDDTVIDPESIVKTYTFLSLLKEEYNNIIIGGSMFRLDQPSIQVESGAVWNEGKLLSIKNGLDLNIARNVVFNDEVEEYTEYHAWWYCCIPMTIVSETNLPLPIFIRGDDVEYGIRNKLPVVTLNGICVWHEPFENKYSSFMNYYIVRNLLIDNSLHYPNYGKIKFLKFLVKRVIREVIYYRYKDVQLIFRGVEDFLKGIDWLKDQDPQALHIDVMNAGYKLEPIKKLGRPFFYGEFVDSINESETRIRRIVRFLTGNGWILPAKRDKIVSLSHVRPINFYRVKHITYYDETSKKAFKTKKSFVELIRIIFQTGIISIKIIIKFNITKKNYKKKMREITNMKFWEKYLEL